MPGVGPSLLMYSFLAEPWPGTQPAYPLAELAHMVEPVPSGVAARGPVGAAAVPAAKLRTVGNCELFQQKLRSCQPSLGAAHSAHLEAPRPDEGRAAGALEMFPRPSTEDELWASLAPVEQSVLGDPRLLEFGGLLALFQTNPEVLPATPPGREHPAAPDVSPLLERWVRRVALGGDARRGIAKLDIGAGRFAGAELIVVAEAGQVAVQLNVAQAADPSLAERLRSRLERRGYSADVVVR